MALCTSTLCPSSMTSLSSDNQRTVELAPSCLVVITDLHGDLSKSLFTVRLAGLMPLLAALTPPYASFTSWAAGPTLTVHLDILNHFTKHNTATPSELWSSG